MKNLFTDTGKQACQTEIKDLIRFSKSIGPGIRSNETQARSTNATQHLLHFLLACYIQMTISQILFATGACLTAPNQASRFATSSYKLSRGKSFHNPASHLQYRFSEHYKTQS